MKEVVFLGKEREEVIDTTIVNQTFPIGVFVAFIYDEDKDEDIFELAVQENGVEDEDINNWTEYLVGSNTLKVFISDGDVIFRNNITGEFMYTNESIVKQADDVHILNEPESSFLRRLNIPVIEESCCA